MMASKNNYNDEKEIINLFESIRSTTDLYYKGRQIHFYGPT